MLRLQPSSSVQTTQAEAWPQSLANSAASESQAHMSSCLVFSCPTDTSNSVCSKGDSWSLLSNSCFPRISPWHHRPPTHPVRKSWYQFAFHIHSDPVTSIPTVDPGPTPTLGHLFYSDSLLPPFSSLEDYNGRPLRFPCIHFLYFHSISHIVNTLLSLKHSSNPPREKASLAPTTLRIKPKLLS